MDRSKIVHISLVDDKITTVERILHGRAGGDFAKAAITKLRMGDDANAGSIRCPKVIVSCTEQLSFLKETKHVGAIRLDAAVFPFGWVTGFSEFFQRKTVFFLDALNIIAEVWFKVHKLGITLIQWAGYGFGLTQEHTLKRF